VISAVQLGLRVGGKTLLEGICLEIEAGKFLGLVGPNGAGKSTLLRLLAGEQRLTKGAVRIAGRALGQWSSAELSRCRGVLPQQSAMAFEIAVRDVVELGRLPHETLVSRAQNTAAVERALALADVAHLATRNYATLSGGEQQRVQLARVLAQIDGVRAPILLLDEPTASLDLAHQHRVLQVARRLAKAGATVVAVLHDLFTASLYCDRIAVLSMGRIIADGRPAVALDSATVKSVFEMESLWVNAGAHQALVTFNATHTP
jgi:iron complex transport system ATP-binding protein